MFLKEFYIIFNLLKKLHPPLQILAPLKAGYWSEEDYVIPVEFLNNSLMLEPHQDEAKSK